MTFHPTRRAFLITASLSAGFTAFGKQGGIKVGCQANAWPLKEGDFDQLIDVVRKMKELGYVGFECNIRFVRGQFDHTSKARGELEATGVQFIGAHMSMQLAAQGQFSNLARGAARLGASYIVMSGRGLSPDGKFSPEALRAKAARLEALGKTCLQNGIKLAYHNHTAEFANRNAEIEGLADHTDPERVHFLMDAGHGYQGGGDPAAFMARDSRRIVGCHIKTFHEKAKQVPLGQGDFGFEALAAAIKKTGWTGWLIDEEGGARAGGDSAAVGPDRQYIRRVFGV
jgi:sugar phosphate isomerase/epimerase